MNKRYLGAVIILLALLGGLYYWFQLGTTAPQIDKPPAQAWADSIVKTLPIESLVGQLIISVQDTDSTSIDRISDLIRSKKTGGILLPGASPEETALLSNYYNSIAPLPLSMAISEPNAPRIHPSFPELPAFLAVQDDSLLYTTGHYFGSLFHEMGINLQLPGPTAIFPPAFTIGMLDAGVSIGRFIRPGPAREKLVQDHWLIQNQDQTICWFQGEIDSVAALMEQGIGIFIAQANEEKIHTKLLQAIKNRRLERDFLEQKASLVLQQKYLNQIARTHENDTLAPDFYPEVLGRQITEAALTLLRNDKNRIPLPSVWSKTIASLSIGTGKKTAFQKMLARYKEIEPFYLKSDASRSARNYRLQQLKEYDYVVVGLHGGVNTADSNFLAFLQDLQKQNRLLITAFGGPDQIRPLGFAQSLLEATDDREVTQQLAAQAIFGGIAIHGRLPRDVGPVFCQADGLDCRKATRMKYTLPEEVGMDSQLLLKVDSLAWAAVSRGTFPGCQILAVKDGKIIYEKAFGYHTYNRKRRVRIHDLYDVASITKIAATTFATMLAYDEEKISLDSTLQAYLPKFDSTLIKNAVINEILTHTSGLPEALPVYFFYTVVDSVDSIRSIYYSDKPDSNHTLQVADELYIDPVWKDTIWKRIKDRKLWTKGQYVYSDLGFFLMYNVLQEIYKTRFDMLVEDRFYKPLGLQRTTYLPLEKFDEKLIIPTENDRFYRNQTVHGHVHDMASALWGGVSGQAGLFSSAHDLGILMQVLLNEGEYGGIRYFSKRTVRKFTRRFNGHRGLGFNMAPVKASSPSICSAAASRECFGHSGFTGCAIWADPKYDLTFVFLSNRVHPSARNHLINTDRVRQNIQSVFYEAMGIYPSTDSVALDSNFASIVDSLEPQFLPNDSQ